MSLEQCVGRQEMIRGHLGPRILGRVGGLGNPLLSPGLETQPVLDFS